MTNNTLQEKYDAEYVKIATDFTTGSYEFITAVDDLNKRVAADGLTVIYPQDPKLAKIEALKTRFDDLPEEDESSSEDSYEEYYGYNGDSSY